MQLKSITAIAVLLFVVASLLVSGCTTSNTSTATPTATPTTTPSNIPQVASSDPSLSTFASLLDKANLKDLLNGSDNFTVFAPVSYTHLRAHETVLDLVCRLLLEKKKQKK